MWWWGNHGAWGAWSWLWMGLGWVWMIAFWGAIIALVVWAVRRLSGGPDRQPPDGPSPMEIARARYARGEISREEFEDIRRTLQT